MRSSPNSHLATAGFTLIEVVVSIALVGIAFGVIFSAWSQSMRTIRRADLHHTAVHFAQNKMSELLVDDTVREGGVLEGQWDETLRWRAHLETQEVDDLAIDKSRLSTRLLYIRLTVTADQYGQQLQAQLFTIKLVPKPPPGQGGHLGGEG